MENKNTVPILEKALDILEYIGVSQEPVSLPELKNNLGIPQASCYRIVTTLVLRGWLDKCSGNRYDIAGGITAVAEKNRFRLEKYKKLQPAMNLLASRGGYSAKLSIRDGDEFVNVCSAKTPSGLLSFSEPGFRSPLRNIASVSTIFLSEEPLSEQKRLIPPESFPLFLKLQKNYAVYGYCFFKGSLQPDTEYPLDTLSFPVKRDRILLGVISLLGLPGSMESKLTKIAECIQEPLQAIMNSL